MCDSKNHYLLNRHIIWHNHIVKKNDRKNLNGHRAILLWFTGLSGSGKSTIASFFEQELYSRSIHTYLLDGDNVRYGLCRDLGFSKYDRYENLRRVGEVAALMLDAGLVVLAAFVSPYHLDRVMVRNMVPSGTFIEIFVDTPLSICEDRDPKGLYRMARCGIIDNFVGIDVIYEKPNFPEVHLDGRKSIKFLIDQLLEFVMDKIIRLDI